MGSRNKGSKIQNGYQRVCVWNKASETCDGKKKGKCEKPREERKGEERRRREGKNGSVMLIKIRKRDRTNEGEEREKRHVVSFAILEGGLESKESICKLQSEGRRVKLRKAGLNGLCSPVSLPHFATLKSFSPLSFSHFTFSLLSSLSIFTLCERGLCPLVLSSFTFSIEASKGSFNPRSLSWWLFSGKVGKTIDRAVPAGLQNRTEKRSRGMRWPAQQEVWKFMVRRRISYRRVCAWLLHRFDMTHTTVQWSFYDHRFIIDRHSTIAFRAHFLLRFYVF